VWGSLAGTGLKPGATITICDNVAGCYNWSTVPAGGSFTLSPGFCCDAARTYFYVISTTAANSLQITSNSVSYP
jgi:hypothetical protein